MAARARAQMAANGDTKDLVARSPEEKRLLALSKLGKDGCVVWQS